MCDNLKIFNHLLEKTSTWYIASCGDSTRLKLYKNLKFKTKNSTKNSYDVVRKK